MMNQTCSTSCKLSFQPSYLRLGSKNFGIQCVGHHVAGWVSHPNEDVRGDVLGQVDGGSILTPGLFKGTACWI